MPDITVQEIVFLREEFEPLLGLRVDWLALPGMALPGFEPSQIAVIVNTILDAALPQIQLLATNSENAEKLKHIGLSKSPSLIGERESYPDYIHRSGYRVELTFIIDIGLFSMIECIRARDNRLLSSGGRWYQGIPQVVKKSSLEKYQRNQQLDDSDFEKDTNFGKLKRIPYAPLQAFLNQHGTI